MRVLLFLLQFFLRPRGERAVLFDDVRAFGEASHRAIRKRIGIEILDVGIGEEGAEAWRLFLAVAAGEGIAVGRGIEVRLTLSSPFGTDFSLKKNPVF